MQYHINHVHVRAQDPHASAAWYEKYFNARKLCAREIMPGTVTVSMEVGGPVRLNISSKPARNVGRAKCRGTEPAGAGAFRLRRGRSGVGTGPAGRPMASA